MKEAAEKRIGDVVVHLPDKPQPEEKYGRSPHFPCTDHEQRMQALQDAFLSHETDYHSLDKPQPKTKCDADGPCNERRLVEAAGQIWWSSVIEKWCAGSPSGQGGSSVALDFCPKCGVKL